MSNNGHKPATLSKPFRNRITGAGMERVDQLLANPANWRLHPDNQQQALAGAIDDIGFIRSVTVNKTTGCVLDGHLRVTLAARSGVDSLPVEYVELTPAEESEALLTLDPIAAMAAADKAKLDELMRQVNSDDARVQAMIAELAEREHIQYGEPPPDDPGAQIDKAEELRVKWGVETGQLWQLGEHRLIVGDCTDKSVVERVMGGEKAALFATDPPYGVAYNDETGSGKGDMIANDENDGPKLQAFLESCFRVWLPYLEDSAAWYLWHAQLTQGFFAAAAAAAAADILIHRQIIWVKPSLIMGHGDYHWRHELCFYGWQKGNRPPFYGERNQSTVWEIGRSNETPHPTEKPPELWDAPINNNTRRGDICAEPFCGSGSQIIACERLGRKCRAVEISPAYCAVAIERWAQMTGGEPELIA